MEQPKQSRTICYINVTLSRLRKRRVHVTTVLIEQFRDSSVALLLQNDTLPCQLYDFSLIRQ